MKHIDYNEFNDVVFLKDKSLVLFYADWCPYCDRFKSIFESKDSQVNQTYMLFSTKLNEDDNPLWVKFDINSIPTIIAFEKEKIVARRDAIMGIGLTRSDLDSLVSELNWH